MLQSEEGQVLMQKFFPSGKVPDSVILYANQKVWIKSEAILVAFRIINRLKWLTRMIAVLPVQWRDRIYDGVASNRYRWFGRYENCQLPSGDFLNQLQKQK